MKKEPTGLILENTTSHINFLLVLGMIFSHPVRIDIAPVSTVMSIYISSQFKCSSSKKTILSRNKRSTL